MIKNLEKISPKFFFNIKYIIISDNPDNCLRFYEEIMHFPWDIREVFQNDKKTLDKLFERGLIFPNYVVVDSVNIEKLLREYESHIFTIVIHDNNINPNVVSRFSDIFFRFLDMSERKISSSDVFNLSDIQDFDMPEWARSKVNHYGKYCSTKYLKGVYSEEELSRRIEILPPFINDFLGKINYLTLEFNKNNYSDFYLNKKINLEEIVNGKLFFELNQNLESNGITVQSLEDEYFYYGKYSRKLIQENSIQKKRKKLAVNKISKLHDLEDIKRKILFPMLYTKINGDLFFALDYDVNKIRQEVNLIANHCRSDNSFSNSEIKKHYKALSHLASVLNSSVDKNSEVKKLKEYLTKKDSHYNFKLNSTLPLGWIDINGCPLSLKFMYSIMPNNKGNVINTRKLVIKKDKPFDVLIIRSFDDDDRLKFLMEKALETARDSKFKLNNKEEKLDANFRFVDVTSEDHLLSELNNSTENILIFDCHGTKIDDEGNYGLYLYGEKVNLFNLKNKITRMPPIVIFSSCDSFPLNANQNFSPAQLTIDLGARIAIGTYLPIDGRFASIAISRLLHRLQQYVDIAIEKMKGIDFSNIFHGWFLMMYTYEVLNFMVLDKVINMDEKYKIQSKVNMIINPINKNWFDLFIEILLIDIQSFHSKDDILNYLWSNIAITDSMKYVCIGYPENVYIVKDDDVFDGELFDIIS